MHSVCTLSALLSYTSGAKPSLNVKQCNFVFKERAVPIIAGGSFINFFVDFLSLKQGHLTLERAKKITREQTKSRQILSKQEERAGEVVKEDLGCVAKCPFTDGGSWMHRPEWEVGCQ